MSLSLNSHAAASCLRSATGTWLNSFLNNSCCLGIDDISPVPFAVKTGLLLALQEVCAGTSTVEAKARTSHITCHNNLPYCLSRTTWLTFLAQLVLYRGSSYGSIDLVTTAIKGSQMSQRLEDTCAKRKQRSLLV
jgi:hypothetical protein